MTTHEHAAQDHNEGNPGIALGYAIVAISGLFVGLIVAWLV